jgi:hypothetical protein
MTKSKNTFIGFLAACLVGLAADPLDATNGYVATGYGPDNKGMRPNT